MTRSHVKPSAWAPVASQGAIIDPPAVGSQNIVIDQRAGGDHDIQQAGVTSAATAFSVPGATGGVISRNVGVGTAHYPLDFTTDYDGSGTNAFRVNWEYMGGWTGGPYIDCDNSNGEHETFIYYMHYVTTQNTRIIAQCKYWWGRTSAGGGWGDSAVGAFDHSGPSGGHKFINFWRYLSGNGKYGNARFWIAYNGPTNGISFRCEEVGYETNEFAQGQTPTNPHDYNNQIVTFTVDLTPSSASGVYDGIVKFWINDKQIFDVDTVPLQPWGWGELMVGGPTWACPPQDQTQYNWDLVVWTP